MAKSLKEALLEKFSDLQELGIAPTIAPIEDEGPSIVVDAGSESRREGGARRQRPSRMMEDDDESRRGGDVPIRPRSRPRRPERGERGAPGERPRRNTERSGTGERAPDLEGPQLDRPVGPPAGAPADRSRFGDRPQFGGGDRPPFGARPPLGQRPPFGSRPPMGPRPPGPGGQQFAGPGEGGPRQPGVTDRLRERAEQRRRDQGEREQLQRVLTEIMGAEPDSDQYDKFLADLTVEVGALPPLERLVEALQLANSVEPAKVGDQVRALYRRPRPRPAALPR